MYWLTSRNVVVALPRWRSLALLVRPRISVRGYSSFVPSPYLPCRHSERIYCFKDRKILKGTTKARKLKASNDILDDKDLAHLAWWKERLQMCRKPSTVQLVKRLVYSNLLGLDVNLKSGRQIQRENRWPRLTKRPTSSGC
ncbi:DNA mismatch repair protein MSH1, mitochondrial-like isoform X2 [Carica papaya]|uniref:DNA mismatch repair protein MSH1, mitochondrial-like isoform X2 n=1 Tax=Carica papaya TaxID=3649 RepID=UPI000B8CFA91|nr:DNA mismatch repair protein MSH1, mitochondrial-like isoform X2 [Carica papaya]